MKDPCLLPVAGGICGLLLGHAGPCLSHSELKRRDVRPESAMTEENMKALLDTFRQEAREQRHDRIVRHLDKSGGPTAELLARVDSDVRWFRVWTGALGYGATCPSQSLRQQVRDTIRGRFTELRILTAEERTLLEELERARDLGAQP